MSPGVSLGPELVAPNPVPSGAWRPHCLCWATTQTTLDVLCQLSSHSRKTRAQSWQMLGTPGGLQGQVILASAPCPEL